MTSDTEHPEQHEQPTCKNPSCGDNSPEWYYGVRQEVHYTYDPPTAVNAWSCLVWNEVHGVWCRWCGEHLPKGWSWKVVDDELVLIWGFSGTPPTFPKIDLPVTSM